MPVLVLTGQVPRSEAAGPYFQEVDQQKLFDDVCVFNETVTCKEQLPRVLQRAIHSALVLRGVAHLALPTDITLEDINIAKTSKAVLVLNPNLPDSNAIKTAASMIKKAKKVALLVGCGCRNAKQEVAALAELLQAPVVHSLKGTEILPFDHPHSIGGVGHVGTPHGMEVLDKCDLLLMLGTDFPYGAFLPKHGKIIQVNINAEHLGRRCAITLGIAADVRATLSQLSEHLEQQAPNGFLQKLQAKRDKWIKKVNHKFDPQRSKTTIHPQSVILELNHLADPDAIFVGEVGEVTVWVARHLRMHSEQRLIGSYNHGSLGVGLPAAIGAQFAYPKRQVIALCGDGAFSMLMGDFVVAVHYDLPLTVIVFNNGKYGFVELEMEAAGYPRFATDLVNPDFAKIAEACGGQGISVSDPKQLRQALSVALSSNKPTIVDVKVNPNELIIPPAVSLKDAWLFTQGKIKEMLIEKNIKVLFER